MKKEETEYSKTSAYKIQTTENYQEESIKHSEHEIFHVEWNLHLISQYLKPDIWNSLTLTLSRELKANKICNS